MTDDARHELGYVPAPPAPPSAPKPTPLPVLTTDQRKVLKRVHRRIALNRNIWTLLSMSELAHMKLIAPNNERNEFWVLTPLGVEVLEHLKDKEP